MNVTSVGRAPGALLAANFSDPTNERLIWLSAAGLVLLGIGLLVATILWWHRGRQEHPSLGPLEMMGTRSWAKAPEVDRARKLDHVRPPKGDGDDAIAPPLALPRPEPVDLQALVRSMPQAFDDLREPVEVIAVDSNGVAVVPAPLVAVSDPAKESAESTGTEPAAEPAAEAAEAAEPVPPEPEPVADATAIAAERPVVSPAPEVAPSSPS